jgi:bifunctional enzyme Fae/Hps
MQIEKNRNKANLTNLIRLIILFFYILFITRNPILSIIFIIIVIFFLKKILKYLTSYSANYQQKITKIPTDLNKNNERIFNLDNQKKLAQNEQPTLRTLALNKFIVPANISNYSITPVRLERHKKYLHIALNSTLEEAKEIISQLPISDRILIEAGTPLIKIYGTRVVSEIKEMTPAGTYIIADTKCADLAVREVEMTADAGANASTCLGVAPIETIDSFIEECKKFNIDSIIDMMNVESAISVLKKLKKLPDVVMLHRGVDESEFSKEKQIPYYEIKQIKGNYNVLIAVAGGDTIKEVQRAIFNDADIVVVWKYFYQSTNDTARIAEEFLKEIK